MLWITPGNLKYDRDGLYFLAVHYDFLLAGRYPPDPSTSANGVRASGVSQAAPHQMALDFKAELDRRLALCNGDGKLLLSECRRDVRMVNLPWECMCALNYISWSTKGDTLLWEHRLPDGGAGISGRKTLYSQWKAVRTNRRKAAVGSK